MPKKPTTGLQSVPRQPHSATGHHQGMPHQAAPTQPNALPASFETHSAATKFAPPPSNSDCCQRNSTVAQTRHTRHAETPPTNHPNAPTQAKQRPARNPLSPNRFQPPNTKCTAPQHIPSTTTPRHTEDTRPTARNLFSRNAFQHQTTKPVLSQYISQTAPGHPRRNPPTPKTKPVLLQHNSRTTQRNLFSPNTFRPMARTPHQGAPPALHTPNTETCSAPTQFIHTKRNPFSPNTIRYSTPGQAHHHTRTAKRNPFCHNASHYPHHEMCCAPTQFVTTTPGHTTPGHAIHAQTRTATTAFTQWR